MITHSLTHNARFSPAAIHLPAPDCSTLAAALVALANTDGGTILTPADDPAAVETALHQAAEKLRPPLTWQAPTPIQAAQGPALLIRVPRSRRVHALADGQTLVHTANGLRALSGNEIRALVGVRHHGDFEAEVVPGARIADLDPALLEGFRLAWARAAGEPLPPDDLPLDEIGAITPDGAITVAGLLLFGRDPQAWLPQSRARVVRHATSPTDNGLPPVYDRIVRGPLIDVIERLWRLINEQVPARQLALPFDRPMNAASPAPLYAAGAVRAALVNALAHRDYRLRGDGITVNIWPEALEITSPGGLPGFITHPHDCLNHHYQRNPRLCWALAQWGYGGGRSPGMKQIMETRRAEISARPYSVTIHFEADRTGSLSLGDGAGSISACQRAALDHVRSNGSITLRELQTLCAGVAPRVLQAELDGLAAAGHLRRIGKAGARSGYYILP
jgi:ATP-dependent DNA helicase RecG